METVTRHVGELQANERSAAELLLGHRLRGNEQLILQVLDLDVVQPPENGPSASSSLSSSPPQALPTWCNVYEGLTDDEVENLHQSITRSHLTRSVEP
jgi:hypothetical protein